MPRNDREKKAVVGQRQRMNTTGAPGLLTLTPTQLIQAHVDQPRQWVVTVMPALKGDTAIPFTTPGDGTATYTPGTTLPGLPFLPDAGQFLQLLLRWGAGGVAWTVAFDYPAHGCAFGVTCDTFDMQAFVRGTVAAITYPTVNDVPVIGAYMVEGQAADPNPLGYQEFVGALAGAATLFWSVKPFARRVRIAVPGGCTTARATFLDTQSAIVWQETRVVAAGDTPVFDITVPQQATVLQLTNVAGGASSAYVEWKLGFV